MINLNNHTLGRLSQRDVFSVRQFLLNGVDETDRVIALPSITRQAKTVSAGYADIRVFNGDQYWNKVHEKLTDNLLLEGIIRLVVPQRDDLYINSFDADPFDAFKFYSGENLDIFTGKLDDIEYIGDTAILKFRDKMGYIFDRKIGSEEEPVDLYTAVADDGTDWSGGKSPADMMWYILTDSKYGGLDNTASSANVDINYTQFQTWETKMAALGFLLQGNFTGQTIGDILSKIATMSHSTFFAEGDGLIYCRYWLDEIDSAGSADHDLDNIFKPLTMRTGTGDIINRVTVFWGYDAATGNWSDHVDKDTNVDLEDTTSQTNYGLRPRTYEDVNVWLPTAVAADAFGEKVIVWWADPRQEVEMDTGLMGFPHQLSDAMRIIYPMLRIETENDKAYAIEELTLNIEDGTCSWKMRKANLQDYFILDHASLGLLDEATNPVF